jgi:AraC family transcriptional regulator, transcriptional activator for feuABC-ybbA operon
LEMNIPGSWLPIENRIFRLRNIEFCRVETGEAHPRANGVVMRLLLVVTGEGVLKAGERRHLARPGSWILLPAEAPYVVYVQEGAGMAYYVLAFTVHSDTSPEVRDSVPEETLEEAGLLWCGAIPEREFTSVIAKAKQLYVGRDDEEGLERFRLQLVFQEFMYLLIQTALIRPKAGSEEAIWSVVRYMEANFQHMLTRDRLAGLAGMNQEYFSRLFKRVTGQTPKSYLTDIRLNHAKRELLRGSTAISDLAQHVGFEEGYYFSRKFKQLTGMSPTEYASKQVSKVACTFFPYLDHMLALGIMPYAAMLPRKHPLALRVTSSIALGEEELDFNARSAEILSVAEPEMILCSNYLNPEQERLLARIAPTVPIVWDQNWRRALREIAAVLGRRQEAENALRAYEQCCVDAGERVRQRLGEHTVALLRIHRKELRLYGGPGQGYTGPVLYGDLGLNAPSLVRELAWNSSVVGILPDGLSRLDADHLLLVVDPDAQQHAAEIMESPAWKGLPAVRGGNVHHAGYYVWMSCGTVMNTMKLEEAVRFLCS